MHSQGYGRNPNSPVMSDVCPLPLSFGSWHPRVCTGDCTSYLWAAHVSELVGAQDQWSTLSQGGWVERAFLKGKRCLGWPAWFLSVFLSPFLYEERFFLKRIYDESAAASSPSGIKGSDKGESLSSTLFSFCGQLSFLKWDSALIRVGETTGIPDPAFHLWVSTSDTFLPL